MVHATVNVCPLVSVAGGGVVQVAVEGAGGLTVTVMTALNPCSPVAVLRTCTAYRRVVGTVTVGAVRVAGLAVGLDVNLLGGMKQHAPDVGSKGSQCTLT